MKSLTDLANSYDECAKGHEDAAEMILVGVASYALGIRERQYERADWLMAEATGLRARAANLRKANAAMLDELRRLTPVFSSN